MATVINLTRSQLESLPETLARSLSFDLVNKLVHKAPVDTGALTSSFRAVQEGNEWVIMAKPYAKYVEYGTPPHIILPSHAKALRFEVNRTRRLNQGKSSKQANIVFTKKVRHPGTRPQPFIRPTLRNDLPRMVADIIAEIGR